MTATSAANSTADSAVNSAPAIAALLGMCVVLALLLASSTPSGLPNGDAAVYAQQILERSFGERTVHVGYVVIAAVMVGFTDQAPDRVFNLLSVVFAVAAALIIGLTTAQLWAQDDRRRWWAALMAAASLAASSIYWRNGVWAEIYMLQTLCLALAGWLFWTFGDRLWAQVSAGVALAAAVVVTPSSLLAVPGLVLGRPRPRAVLVLGAVGATLTLAAIVPQLDDYLHGGRGLLGASTASLGIVERVLKEGVEVVFGVFCLLPLLLAGLAAAWRQDATRRLLLALGGIWGVTFLFGERFRDVPVQLPTWIMMAPLVGVGALACDDLLRSVSARARLGWLALGGALALAPIAAMAVARTQVTSVARLPAGLEWALVGMVALAVLVAWALMDRGASSPWQKSRLAVAVLFVGWAIPGLLVAWLQVRDENVEIDGYRSAALELAEHADDDFLVLSSWERGILLEHYMVGESYTGRWVNARGLGGQLGDSARDDALRQLAEARAAGRQMWLHTEVVTPSLEGALMEEIDDLDLRLGRQHRAWRLLERQETP